MISHPQKGIGRSVKNHNSDLMVATDWVELSVLVNSSVSRSDFVDHLTEALIYEHQDFCSEFWDAVIAEVRRRSRALNGVYPFDLDGDVVRSATPQGADSRGYQFFLLLSLGPKYTGWADRFSGNYALQGVLFEKVVAAGLAERFPGWNVDITGWSDGAGAVTAEELIQGVADRLLEEQIAGAAMFMSGNAKDAGVDIILARAFADQRPAVPAILVQCASGRNWVSKLNKPNTAKWLRLISLTHKPLRSLAMPVVVSADDYDRLRNEHTGLLLDRLRLVPGQLDACLESEDADALTGWISKGTDWILDTESILEGASS